MDELLVYKESYEHINEWFNLLNMCVDCYEKKGRVPPDSPYLKDLLTKIQEQEKKIREKTKITKQQGKWLSLEYLADKYHLNYDERFILCGLIYHTIFGGKFPVKLAKVLKVLALKNNLGENEYLRYLKYLLPEGKLYKIVRISSFDNDELFLINIPDIRRLLSSTTKPEEFCKSKKSEPGERIKKIKVLQSPKQLYERVNEYVVGQEEAKRKLSVAVFNQIQRNWVSEKSKGPEIEKSNVLIIGPTGTGKTYLCKTISNLLDLPRVTFSATQFTETGYVGLDVSEMLVKLKEEGEKKKRPWDGCGIVYLDEVDKISAQNIPGKHYGRSRDVSGRSVQEELLSLFDNSLVHLRVRKGFSREELDFDTRKVLFICGGAFAGLEEIIVERMKKKSDIGFKVLAEDKGEQNYSDKIKFLKRVTPDDLINYGLIPEFVGRLNVIAVMNSLSEDDLVEIMVKPRNALVKQYKKLLSASGVKIELSETIIRLIARTALKKGVGARGLRSMMEEIVSPIIFRSGKRLANKNREYKKIKITEPELENILNGETEHDGYDKQIPV